MLSHYNSSRFMDIGFDIKGFLQRRFAQPLPGPKFQANMTVFKLIKDQSVPKDAKPAAVLQLFYPHRDEWHIVFIKRTSRVGNDHHKGQISFPGGKSDPEDISMENTALREAKEELNIDPSQVEIIGQMSTLYIPVSGFNVFPFVGVSHQRPNLTPDPIEVDDYLEVPLSFLLNPDNIKTKTISASYGTMPNYPHYQFDEHIIWGATGMMIGELVAMFKSKD